MGAHTDKHWFSCRFVYKREHTEISAVFFGGFPAGAHTGKCWFSCRFACKRGQTQTSAGFLAVMPIVGGAYRYALVFLHVCLEVGEHMVLVV